MTNMLTSTRPLLSQPTRNMAKYPLMRLALVPHLRRNIYWDLLAWIIIDMIFKVLIRIISILKVNTEVQIKEDTVFGFGSSRTSDSEAEE